MSELVKSVGVHFYRRAIIILCASLEELLGVGLVRFLAQHAEGVLVEGLHKNDIGLILRAFLV